MAPAHTRPVQLWEQIGCTVSVSMFMELQGPGVTGTSLAHVCKSLQTEHPFLRTGIEYVENVATFIDLPNSDLIPVTKVGLYSNWQARLQEVANEFKDLAEGVVSMELASSGEQHQLFLTINHAGK